jgi:GTP pyrophosphokinase
MNVDKMYTYLKGYCMGANMLESVKALNFARQQHADQKRKDGTPYIVHPLGMACYAVALGINDDNVIATILLHDVVEDCGIPVEGLPVNATIRRAVNYMTITRFDDIGLDKIAKKCLYFDDLLENREALICKALDRYNNLSDMLMHFTKDAMGKNVAETEVLLLPVLKGAKDRYPELNNILFALRINISTLNEAIKVQCPDEYLKWHEIYSERKLSNG